MVMHLPHFPQFCDLLNKKDMQFIKKNTLHSILGAVLNNYMFAQFVESSETINIYKCIYMFSIFIIYIAVSIILYLQKKPFDPAIKMREFLYLMKVWSSILHINLNN